jgi:hypothetical protein
LFFGLPDFEVMGSVLDVDDWEVDKWIKSFPLGETIWCDFLGLFKWKTEVEEDEWRVR